MNHCQEKMNILHERVAFYANYEYYSFMGLKELKAKNKKFDIYNNLFVERLLEAFAYRATKQKELGENLYKSQSVISKWTSTLDNQVYPNPIELAILAYDILHIDINFFFREDITIEEADLNKNQKINPLNSFFIETTVSESLFSVLNEILNKTKLYLVTYYPHSGITTALKEFERIRSDVKVLNTNNLDDFEKYKTLIFDNVEFNNDLKEKIISLKNSHCIIIIRNRQNLDPLFEIFGNSFDYSYYIEHISESDINCILLHYFPSLDNAVLELLRKKTLGRIDRLFDLIKILLKIEKKEITFENVFKVI